MENRPLVSIIMATYNREQFIGESLSAIQNQTFQSWECLIVDDGGSDDTVEVVQAYQLNDKRFKYFRRDKTYKKGLPGCRNFGLDKSVGENIVFIDDDDIAHPELLRISLKELQKYAVDYCRYSRAIFFGEFSLQFDLKKKYSIKELGYSNFDAILVGEIPFNSCQILWRRTCFDDNRFNEELMYAEEWELYSRILLTGKKGVSVSKILYYGRKHEESNTGEFKAKNPKRINSQIIAAQLVIRALAKRNHFNKRLKKFFVRMGFDLKAPEIIFSYLRFSDASLLETVKYKSGYLFYPILKPVFRFKSKIYK